MTRIYAWACLAVLLTLAGLTAAQVYRGIDADGRPFYSDRPIADAEPVTVPGLPTPPEVATPDAATPEAPAGGVGFRGSYDAFEMITPADGLELRDAEGRVSVSLLLAPPLMAGHRLSISVDGVAAGGDASGTQIELRGLAFGSHRLQAMVQDDVGVPVAATDAVNIHIRPPLPAGALP